VLRHSGGIQAFAAFVIAAQKALYQDGLEQDKPQKKRETTNKRENKKKGRKNVKTGFNDSHLQLLW
jgi:hypothetical protein